jgi:hypothetical protein
MSNTYVFAQMSELHELLSDISTSEADEQISSLIHRIDFNGYYSKVYQSNQVQFAFTHSRVSSFVQVKATAPLVHTTATTTTTTASTTKATVAGVAPRK